MSEILLYNNYQKYDGGEYSLLLKHRIRNLLASRQSIIQSIEDESDFFYERMEDIDEFFLKSFYSQVISCTIGDIYDYCEYIRNKRNLFYQKLRFLGQDGARAIYKTTAMYHTVHYLASGTYKGDDPADMPETLRNIFDLNQDECDAFSALADTYWESEALFEAKFSKYAARQIFGTSNWNPWKLAYVNFYFMNSYQQFIETNHSYVA